jgi:uncharacterized RDD family membrane protein YckC
MVAVIWLLGFFVLRNFYFVAFELSARAATPGKRAMGLRVASRDGGRLRAESRSSPATPCANWRCSCRCPCFGSGGEGGVESWMYLLGFLGGDLRASSRCSTADRLRLGDLIGGTWVVRTPKPQTDPRHGRRGQPRA